MPLPGVTDASTDSETHPVQPLQLTPDAMRELGYRVVDLLVGHLTGLRDERVSVQRPRAELDARIGTGFDEEPTPASDIREAVKDIDEEVDRLNRTVNDVLDFARPPSVVREQSDLVRLCQDVVGAAAVGGGPAIDLTVPAAPLMTDTDPERLRTALINVLSNARQAVAAREAADATPLNGRAAVHLTLDQPDPGHVRLRVTDHGAGIKPEHLPQVFEPYFTTRRTGTGLGLPIARNIVEGLGGTIGVDTAPGLTTVEIVLPL